MAAGGASRPSWGVALSPPRFSTSSGPTRAITPDGRRSRTCVHCHTRSAGLPNLGTKAIALTSSTRIEQSDHKGFDTCSSVTTSGMQTWWYDSPYGAYGFYIDVLNGTCFYPSATFVSTVQSQGWNVMPIFSGRQVERACYPSGFTYPGYSKVLSSDLTTDSSLADTDAQTAISTAENAGIDWGSDIYIDMEAYAPSQTDNGVSCNSIVNAYLSEFVTDLVTRYCGSGVNHYPCPYHVGIYALTEASAMASFASFNNVPREVWGAQADGNATTWNFHAVSNSDWYEDQRIKQYVGDSTENYGGVQLLIDRDCVNTLVDGSDSLWKEGSESSESYSSGDDPGC